MGASFKSILWLARIFKTTVDFKFELKTYLKKSFLQYNFASRLKHFSVKGVRHSQHLTHEACQPLSSTFNKNLSKMGLLQPAHGSPTPFGSDRPGNK